MPSTTQGKNIRLEFLAANRVVLSDGGDLSALPSSNSSAALDPGMRDRLSRIAGAPVFAEINAAEFSSRAGANGGNQTAGFSATFASLRWISLAARPDGEQVFLSAEGECDNPQGAQRVAGTLELLRGILRGALADPKARGQMPPESAAAAGKLLENMKITTEEMRARVLVAVTPEMLRLPPNPVPAGH